MASKNNVVWIKFVIPYCATCLITTSIVLMFGIEDYFNEFFIPFNSVQISVAILFGLLYSTLRKL